MKTLLNVSIQLHFQFSELCVITSRTINAPADLTPGKIPSTHFCQRLNRPQGHIAAGRITSIEKSNDLIGNRTRDLPACSILPQPTMLPHKLKLNSVAVVRKRTIPTERPPLVGEVSAKLCG
jgi:hypothetical protein